MPSLKIIGQEMHIHFSFWEKLLALRGDISVALGKVRGATDDPGFSGREFGLRLFGTNIPGLISAGEYRKSGSRQFVFVARGKVPVVIELEDQKWDRIILGASDARATANTISVAISSPREASA